MMAAKDQRQKRRSSNKTSIREIWINKETYINAHSLTHTQHTHTHTHTCNKMKYD